MFNDHHQITQRCQKRGKPVTFTRYKGTDYEYTEVYSIIPACLTRNYDGKLAGYPPSDRREVLQRITIKPDSVTYTNWW